MINIYGMKEIWIPEKEAGDDEKQGSKETKGGAR